MKKLKTILQHRWLYIILLILSFVYFLIVDNYNFSSSYINFNDEVFIITNIKKDDDKMILNLKGKDKIIGYFYYKDNLIDLSLGDKIKITGDELDISNNTVFNIFNYKKYLYNQKIYNVINITKIDLVKKNNNIFYKLKNIMFRQSNKLTKSFSYVNSFILGNNYYIDNDIKTSYRDNGISHLFAISGMHISFFILIIDKLLNKLKINNYFKYLILILFLIIYMFITNFSMSIMRCSIFTILLYLNRIFKLDIKSIYLLILTLVIIIFINPLNIYNIGLQFSFVITFYLILFSSIIKGKYIKKLFITSLISFIVSYPIVVNNFYQVNFLSIIYNIFFVPYVSFIMLPLVILTYIFPFLDSILYFFINILEFISINLNKINFSKVILCKINIIFVIIYYLLITFILIMIKKGKNKYVFLILVFFVIHYFSPLKKEDYILFFDVGQGDSILININNQVVLVDTGGTLNYEGKNIYTNSKNKIIPYLKSKGIRKINNLILTHGDNDHMGDSIYLVNNFKVENVNFNCGDFNDLENELIKVLEGKKIKYYSCISELKVDKYELQFLNTKIYDNENDNSSVIYLNYSNYNFLFMGDASIKREKDILYYYDISNIDFIKIGHHGSNTSSSNEFISIIKPKYSLISVGSNNRYNHPKEEVLNILENNNSKIYRTDIDGSIEIKINKKGYSIETCSP